VSNLVVHFEIHASEPQKLIDYYSALFGWSFTQFGDMDYWSIDTGEGSIGSPDRVGGGINGGLTKRMGPAPAVGAPVVGADIVVAVDGSVDEVFQHGIELGGIVALPLDDHPGIGRFGYLVDPDGNVFGILSPTLSDGTVAMT
jgi:uncharacterized protein